MGRLYVTMMLCLLVLGCGNPIGEFNAPLNHLEGSSEGPQHILWGKWGLRINPPEGIGLTSAERDTQAHFNVTNLLNPPKCSDCLKIIIAGWNPVTRIADITLVLKNPTSLTGYDVKAIISDYDKKEFLNPDGWTDLYTDGSWWDPYYIFLNGEAFEADKTYAIGFQLRFPVGSTTHASVLIDASWPSYQEEPWRINNVIVAGPLQNDFYHYIGFTCHIYDHQNNMQAVTVDLSPLGPPNVPLGDNGLSKDYLPNDGIWGLSYIKTSTSPGTYDFWIRAKSLNTEKFTYQKVSIEVIPPLAVQPPLYIVSMMHAEEALYFLEEDTYLSYAQDIRDLAKVFSKHGAKIALGPDWTFIQGTQNFDPTLFSDLQAEGHGVDTHAHETTYDLGQVHDMLDSMNVQDTIIANGGFNKTWDDPPGGNWAAYIAHFKTLGGQQMFLAAVAYKDPVSQFIDSLFTPIRPSLTGDWMVHDPSSPLVYISGGLALNGSAPQFFTELPNAVNTALAGVIPGKINCCYWHDSVHNYGGTIGDARIGQWDILLKNYFDPKVKEGKLIWANFAEMYQAYIDWEG